MTLFTSKHERNYWLLASAIFTAIYSTLFIGEPIITILQDQNIQAIIFMVGLILVGIAIVTHGIRRNPGILELAVWCGVGAVGVMLFLRMGLSERSHLIEYSILSIFIHKAIRERAKHQNRISRPALVSFMLTFLIGFVDECIQIILTHRVFDPTDLLFNGVAIAAGIWTRIILDGLYRLLKRIR